MNERKQTIEKIMQNMHSMKSRVMDCYGARNKIDITPSQGFVLRFVAENKSSNVKAIAEKLQITSSAATQLIDGLVEKNYLIRETNPDDRRTVSLKLSEKAKKLFKKFKEQGLKKMTELFETLSDAELEKYAELNQKIVDNINKKV